MADADHKMTINQVADVIESEGLGYAVQHYMSADMIADSELAALWASAQKALNDLEEFVNATKTVEDEEDFDDSDDESDDI